MGPMNINITRKQAMIGGGIAASLIVLIGLFLLWNTWSISRTVKQVAKTPALECPTSISTQRMDWCKSGEYVGCCKHSSVIASLRQQAIDKDKDAEKPEVKPVDLGIQKRLYNHFDWCRFINKNKRKYRCRSRHVFDGTIVPKYEYRLVDDRTALAKAFGWSN